MWVAYIDESGQPNFRDKNEMFYTVSALILHDSQIEALNNQVEKIKREVLPARYWSAELHANEIVHGNKDYSGLRLDIRIELMDRLHEYIGNNQNITIISVIVDKNQITENIGHRLNLKRGFVTDKTRKLAYKLLIERLAWYITHIEQDRGSKWTILIIDESTILHQRGTANDLDIEKRVGIYTSRIPGSKHILIPPLFASSSQHTGIQLADVVAYTISKWAGKKYYGIVKKYFDFEKYFELLSYRFYKDDRGRYEGYGLKYWNSPSYLI